LTLPAEFYLDRFEGETAVLTSEGLQLNLPRELLPPDAREGDFLNIGITLNAERRRQVTEEIEQLRRQLETGEES
jgi:hypothetical protein